MDNLTYLIANAPTAPNWFHPAGYDKKPDYGEMLANDIQKQDAMSICNEYDFKLDIEWRIYWARSVLLQLEGEGIWEAKRDDPEGDVMYRVQCYMNEEWKDYSILYQTQGAAEVVMRDLHRDNPGYIFKVVAQEAGEEDG